jgi:HJR/Mrr/RecB family endonuclease
MQIKSGLSKRARQISLQDRMVKLMSFKETEFHQYLEKLFSEMDKEAVVRITHGSTELGADLIVIRRDEFRSQ